jgi:uncharacterized membrane protein YesL
MKAGFDSTKLQSNQRALLYFLAVLVAFGCSIAFEWQAYEWLRFPSLGGFIGQFAGLLPFAGIIACLIILIRHRFKISRGGGGIFI